MKRSNAAEIDKTDKGDVQNDFETKRALVALTSQSGLLGTDTLVNNMNIISYFDTGAEVSIMSKKTARDYGLQIMPTKIKIKVADNSIMPAEGETEPLQVCLGESVCYIKFIVIEHDDHPILLGLDWFECSGASLNPSQNTVTFPRRTVYLNNSNVINKETLTFIDDGNDEGRLDYLLNEDDNLDNFGIDPSEIKQIVVETTAELNTAQSEIWNKITRPSIIDRCSTGTHDIGQFNGDSMIIEVTSQMPVSRTRYRKSQAEDDEVEELDQQLLQAGIIEESSSPYDNPILLTKKKSDKKRVVNDFRELNNLIKPLKFPILLVSLILDMLAESVFFSVCDMTSGFFQCPLDPSSRKYTAYSTSKGHWKYRVCPQGIKTGPAWFSLCVSRAMRHYKGFAINYFDDIVIYSRTLDDHLKHVQLIMNSLKEYGFKISAEKSTWIATEVELLGYVVSGNSIKINPLKIATIRDRPEPKNAKEVQQVLGLFNFYRRFIENFAEISKPL